MSMKAEVRKHLAEDIVPFWQKLEDMENGGFYGWNNKAVRRKTGQQINIHLYYTIRSVRSITF